MMPALIGRWTLPRTIPMPTAGRLPDSSASRSLFRDRIRGPVLYALGPGAAFLTVVLVAAYALWYTSSGRFPEFPAIQNDYVDLGRAFLHGQLSLLESPHPALAGLGNPYEYSQRKDIPYHWDASYYDGQYFLYWGPVPALISAAIEAIVGTPPPASILVVIPYLGLMAVATALLFHLGHAFGAGPRATVWLFILIGFFNLPMLFTIGQPRHYQASIMFGQFFLMGGLLAFVLYARARRPSWLAASGIAWGLAFASRYNLAISIAVYLLLTALWLWRDRSSDSFLVRLGLLAAPLALCLLGLGLYNVARFGNPLETGMTYQLTIPEFRQVSYSAAYIPSGLYSYLLYPLTPSDVFPFIQSAHFRPALLPESIFVPPGREFDQIVFGLLRTVPVVWLGLIAIPLLFALLPRGSPRKTQPSSGVSPGFVFWMLALGAAGQFLYLLVFFYVAERYIVDFYGPVVLCLAIVVWRAHTALQGSGVLQTALWLLVTALTLWTAAIGYFACFGVPVLVSIYYDPQMVANLAAFWNTLAAVLRLTSPGGS